MVTCTGKKLGDRLRCIQWVATAGTMMADWTPKLIRSRLHLHDFPFRTRRQTLRAFCDVNKDTRTEGGAASVPMIKFGDGADIATAPRGLMHE